jgi:hypothetical protein
MKNNVHSLTHEVMDVYLRAPDVHEMQRVGVVGAGMSLVIALVACGVHAMNLWLVLGTSVPLIVPLLVHLVAVSVVAYGAVSLHRVGRDCRFLVLLALSTAVMGVVGAAGTVLSIAMQLWHARLAYSFQEWFAQMFPRKARTSSEDVYDTIMMGRDDAVKSYQVIPFMDTMAMGSQAQKCEAISLMTAQFHPSFAPAFHKAMADGSALVRMQAAHAVARIENKFLSRVMKITDAARRFPRDTHLKLALAEHYDDYAFTGVLDSERESVNRRRALEHYYEYLDSKPNDVGARIKVGRLLLRDGSPELAADWFETSLELGVSSDALIVWYMEALFACGRYEQLRMRARIFITRLEPFRELRPDLADTIRLWAGFMPSSADSAEVSTSSEDADTTKTMQDAEGSL